MSASDKDGSKVHHRISCKYWVYLACNHLGVEASNPWCGSNENCSAHCGDNGNYWIIIPSKCAKFALNLFYSVFSILCDCILYSELIKKIN